MIVTMLAGAVPTSHEDELAASFRAATEHLPPFIVRSMLMRERGTDRWHVLTVWESDAALAEYRRSVDVPEGVMMFRNVGTEPALTILDLAEQT
jgi:heme-degrading monooxygenase HmoA